MGKFVNVDLVRLSQKALPIAKQYDKDTNGTLDEKEYQEFMTIWDKENKDKSPLLMQLHMNTLTEQAQALAQQCDTDEYKGVLTEGEIQKFMDLCEKQNIKTPFKKGTSIKAVLTGNDFEKLTAHKRFQEQPKGPINNYFVKLALFTNWLKLDTMGYKGSDKFFHAVGNYEAMMAGPEKYVKEVCTGQDKDKRENSKRPEADYTEDLYANWLGREFYKMYPGESPHEIFAPLAPTGFDIEKSKQPPAKIIYNNAIEKKGWLRNKISQYLNYFKLGYVRERFFKESSGIIF